MRRRWASVVATGAPVATGCTTLVEVSAPNGANRAGDSVPCFDGSGAVLSGDRPSRPRVDVVGVSPSAGSGTARLERRRDPEVGGCATAAG
jgi:hypothetical protein